jgi:HJR/Mrr/RecB family endonuclease
MSEAEKEQAAQDRQVEMWKVKKLIKSLQAARG